MPTYSYTDLRDASIDNNLYGNATTSAKIRNIINRAVRTVNSEIDLRSAKRVTSLTPKIFDDIYEYPAPTDLKGTGIIDIYPQANRPSTQQLYLATPERFDRKKGFLNNLVALRDNSFVRTLLVDLDVNDTEYLVEEFDETTGWTAFGDAENVRTSDINHVSGSANILFDITATGGTTAGIQKSTVSSFDLTDYLTDGYAFVWTYINSTTNITNYKLRIGSSASDYYELTTTTKADGTSFESGWNLLRLSFSTKTTTGTPDIDSTDYVALYMTKAAGKVSETGYGFDLLTLHTGEYQKAMYYSKYPWQTSAGVYIENSTADTDKLNADTDEMELFTYKVKKEIFLDLREYDQMKVADAEYERLKKAYKLRYPSEAIKEEQLYYYGNNITR